MILPEFGPDDRFVVAAITGFRLNESGMGAATTSYAVLDRWYCHREVAGFPSKPGYPSPAVRLARALTLAAELNAEDAP